jgi:hypothetical protein
MEQPEAPQVPPPEPEPPAKAVLPDPTGTVAIPDHYRMPFFHGKMATPTAVPSATERRRNLVVLQKKRRRRGFLLGLLAGQILIIGLDLGGEFLLRRNPQVKLQAPIPVASIVFLGMATGAAVMIVSVALIFLGMGLRAFFGRRSTTLLTALGHGIQRFFQTSAVLGVTMAVIIGTAWFMIPGAQWKPTIDYTRSQGAKALDASKARVKAFFKPAPRVS